MAVYIMCGINDQKVAMVIFLSLPMGLKSTIQFAGEAFRLSPFSGNGSSNPISYTTTFRQYPHSYCDLDPPDGDRHCPRGMARFNIPLTRGLDRLARERVGGICAFSIVVGTFGVISVAMLDGHKGYPAIAPGSGFPILTLN